ncbi:MAG: trypsin-like peptidase domain-containing protein [Gloeobacteraceae cyanobacterium ES-bin-316]|nr:trypsin-like peptidase domain-containing protein [Ferruginibacter sp.]
MKLKQVFFTALISALTTMAIVWGFGSYFKSDTSFAGQQPGVVPSNYKYTGLFDGDQPGGGSPDFVLPAQAATPTVVHIKTRTNAKQVTNNLPRTQQRNPFSDLLDDDMFNQFFGPRSGVIPEQRASGSGVIISDNGFIVTNNHVVQKADEIMVTLSNKKTYTAKVVGSDPAYDLAVIKIEAAALPYLIYGNSDEVKVGQWVLAIGYPLNLETTVTAGIISAKARSLGLNRDRNGSPANAVESFIQTDAAVNSGNSGGALVNTDGKLIGINSAIASPTGYYSGYSYAIPVNIVKKVVDDIIKFGTVQRAYLGIEYANASDMTEQEKKSRGIPAGAFGIYVQNAPQDGSAFGAGIRKGDVIKSINGVSVTSGAEMQEQVSRYKPGDKVTVVYMRNDKDITTPITLKNKAGNFEVVKAEATVDALGADLVNLDAKSSKEFGVSGGVIVKKVKEGGVLNDQTRMRDGFIILKVNDKNVSSLDELKMAVADKKSVTLSGFYPGYEGLYEYPVTLDNSDN